MKAIKKYFVYLDDGRDVYKIATPAENIADAKQFVNGNGDVVAIKDVTDDYPISITKVYDALEAAHFGQAEMDFICRALERCTIAQ
jgi:hypothetical protein